MLVGMAWNGQTSGKRFILNKFALYIGDQLSLASEATQTCKNLVAFLQNKYVRIKRNRHMQTHTLGSHRETELLFWKDAEKTKI